MESTDSEFDGYWMFDTETSEDSDHTLAPPASEKKGSIPMHVQHPDLVPVLTDFIRQNSAEAHNRRHNATSYMNGVTLRDIQKHAVSTIPGLNSISRSTVHRLMRPSREKTISAKRHKSLIDARVPAKSNNQTQTHSDFHRTCASVNYMEELMFMCADETVALSCDDKNKVNVGTLAVSRHLDANRFFSCDDMPDYPDHDFPYPNSKLIPSGYMMLQQKRRRRSLSPKRQRGTVKRRCRSSSPRRTTHYDCHTDATGRSRVSWPRTGKLNVYLQSSKFASSTSQTHSRHLMDILAPICVGEKKVVSIIADGGPDWSTKSLINLINFRRIWRDMDLDGLVITAYAPGHSKYNPIERAWGPLSKWLIGVTLPRKLPGETRPPCEQSNLSVSEVNIKEARVFDNAMSMCASYWNGRTYDSFPISVTCDPCVPERHRTNDHQLLKEFVNLSKRAVNQDPEFIKLQDELKFLNEHCIRRKYMLEFYKCQSCDFCRMRPVRATKFFNLLHQRGGMLPCPVIDPARIRGEFLTLQDFLSVPGYLHWGLSEGLDDKPNVCRHGCRYVFLSKRIVITHCVIKYESWY